MPRTSPRKVNKSQAIRDSLAQHPNAKTKEIVMLLDKQGIKVHPAMVYMIKGRQKRAAAAAMSQRISVTNPIELVVRLKEISQEVGGFKNLKQLVDLLAE
jgi:hypothetical protein